MTIILLPTTHNNNKPTHIRDSNPITSTYQAITRGKKRVKHHKFSIKTSEHKMQPATQTTDSALQGNLHRNKARLRDSEYNKVPSSLTTRENSQ
ncbi:hypothetical protein BPAE_0224g00180 [Botrytis paeoniae]|uniref:Uncharacterized protein n=1 Tax=Botrytis paeoniae TaxID=278948 RepID=A0A4Z1FD22_9HELO|nr:hypothetical protein BPAE_0224g00180 [Botrytis paeoniae]